MTLWIFQSIITAQQVTTAPNWFSAGAPGGVVFGRRPWPTTCRTYRFPPSASAFASHDEGGVGGLATAHCRADGLRSGYATRRRPLNDDQVAEREIVISSSMSFFMATTLSERFIRLAPGVDQTKPGVPAENQFAQIIARL